MGALSLIIPMLDAKFYHTIIEQNHYDVDRRFSWASLATYLMVYMSGIFGLYHISRIITPRFNSVNLSLIGFILLYVMWEILT